MSDGVYRRHQRRAIALTRAIQGSQQVETELAIPESSRAIDLLISAAEASDAWGVLRDDLAARNVLLEHFSTPPSPTKLATTLLKGAWAVEQWLAARHEGNRPSRWHLPRPPVTLVLSVGQPRKALEFFSMLRASETKGIYRTSEAGLEVVLVDVRNLERIPGTAFLAMFDHRSESWSGTCVDCRTTREWEY